MIPAGDVLAEIDGLLDRVDPDRSGFDPRSRLRLAEAARRVAGRIDALSKLRIGEADRTESSMRAAGTPMSSWLATEGNLSRRESAGLLHRAKAISRHPGVGEAAMAGRVSAGQAAAMVTVLDGLAGQLDPGQASAAERVLVELARSLDADRLAKAAPRVLAAVAPDGADELTGRRLQAEAESAHPGRSLRFFRDGGSVRFDGSLPRVEAEQWMTLLDAHAESLRRTALEVRDPLEGMPSPEQRRADALVAMVRAHQVGRQAPASGGDRPRVLVRLDYERLLRGAALAGLIADGERLSAGELRRLCCDAGLVPAVLGGPSEVLDVGREHRLVTPALRAALVARDGGCAFPSCQARPAVCEAHHITPWWAGGPTALSNLVLLCHHHHALVEPAKYCLRDQWEIRIAADGVPEAIPPARFRTDRRPLRHQRHLVDGPPPAAGRPPPAA